MHLTAQQFIEQIMYQFLQKLKIFINPIDKIKEYLIYFLAERVIELIITFYGDLS